MIRGIITVLSVLLALGAMARAQCDSTPPLLVPAFQWVGPGIDDHLGLSTYVVHDSAGSPQVAISLGSGGNTHRVYSRFSPYGDTAYRCCIGYYDVEECHITGSRYTDYVVHQQGGGDSVFFIPGSADGIWSERRWLLLTSAPRAKVAQGYFSGQLRPGLIISNPSAKPDGTIGRAGALYFWDSISPSHLTPDGIVEGNGEDYALAALGSELAVGDFDHDGFADLCAQSGGYGTPSGATPHGRMVLWGGQDFPSERTIWRDEDESGGWAFASGPYTLDSPSGGLPALLSCVYLPHDTVWGEDRRGFRISVQAGVSSRGSFDTMWSSLWRPPQGPNRTCISGLSQFGIYQARVGDVNGDGAPDYMVSDGLSTIMIYLGGSEFDTIPDVYYVGASTAIGGIDWNNDGVGDLIVPVPSDPGIGGSVDQPKGAVRFISGSRALRQFGVDRSAVREHTLSDSPLFNVYPNPVRTQLMVSGAGPSAEARNRVTIRDMLGRMVLDRFAFPAGRSINLAGFPSGVYQIETSVGAKVYRTSFVHEQ